jgi:hypothetical protein
VAVAPYSPDGEIPTVEHAVPLLMFGTVIVPVTPLGTGLTSGDAPGGSKPFGPTGAPGTVPSEEVTPSGGMTVPTWASAGLLHNKEQAAAAINNGLMAYSPISAKGLRGERPQAPQSVGQRGQRLSFSLPLTKDKLSQHPRRGRRSGYPGGPGPGGPGAADPSGPDGGASGPTRRSVYRRR